MITSRQQNIAQNQNILIGNLAFEKCGKDQISGSNKYKRHSRRNKTQNKYEKCMLLFT